LVSFTRGFVGWLMELRFIGSVWVDCYVILRTVGA
jgi:hypothetical protein